MASHKMPFTFTRRDLTVKNISVPDLCHGDSVDVLLKRVGECS